MWYSSVRGRDINTNVMSPSKKIMPESQPGKLEETRKNEVSNYYYYEMDSSESKGHDKTQKHRRH